MLGQGLRPAAKQGDEVTDVSTVMIDATVIDFCCSIRSYGQSGPDSDCVTWNGTRDPLTSFRLYLMVLLKPVEQ
jgi:hypothetical protein